MANAQFARRIENRAQELRRKLQLGPADVLNPFTLADVMGVKVLSFDGVEGLSTAHRRRLIAEDPDGWSAGTLVLNGLPIVVLNPTHADTRRRATLMEELSHVHLRHKPSELTIMREGVAFRSFKQSQEKQAFGVGAAALIPLTLLKHAHAAAMQRTVLATHCGVSTKLVSFREQITGLRLAAAS